MMSHLDDGLINELLDGEIPSAQLAPIQEHLGACAACRARLETARLMVMESDDLIEALDAPTARAAVPVLPFAPRRSAWPRRLAWAASVTIAVSAGYLARGEQLVPVPALTDAGTARSESLQATPPSVVPETRPQLTAPQPALSDAARSNTATRPTPPPADTDVPVEADGIAQPPALAAGEDEKVARRDSGVGNLVAERERQEVARPAAAAPPPDVRARALDAAGSGRAAAQFEANRLAPRDQAAAKSVVAVDTISLPDAVRLLGGSLRLIEGLVPLRLEAVGSEVRVIYPLAMGTLELTQRLVGAEVRWNLVAPTGFPADSLAVLRSRVKE